MKKLLALIFSFALANTSFGQEAYPLPSTEVFGSLLVQESFRDTFQGYVLGNDSLNLGFIKLPSVGMWTEELYGSGIWFNHIADWSALGGEEREIRIGFGSPIASSFLKIDTLEFRVNSKSIDLFADTIIRLGADVTKRIDIKPDSLTEITGQWLLINADTFLVSDFGNKYINLASQGNINSQAQGQATFSSRKEIYLTANQQDSDNWEYGFTAFTNNNATCCNGTATMFALREDLLLDVQQIYLDSLRMKLSSRYGVNPIGGGYNNNDLIIDSTGLSFTYGLQSGGATWTPTDQYTVTVNSSGFGYVDGNQADGALLRSDASGNASWMLPSYGEMGFGDSASTQSLTQNVQKWITNPNNDLWSLGALQLTSDVVYDGDSLTVTTDGIYDVQIQLTMSGSNGSLLELGLLKNGVEDCFCVSATNLFNNRTLSLTYTDITEVSANDVFKVFVRNTANNDDVDVINGKIIMQKIN